MNSSASTSNFNSGSESSLFILRWSEWGLFAFQKLGVCDDAKLPLWLGIRWEAGAHGMRLKPKIGEAKAHQKQHCATAYFIIAFEVLDAEGPGRSNSHLPAPIPSLSLMLVS